MQDNEKRKLSVMAEGFLPLATQANIATNGRWGVAGMGAVALYIDQPKLAFFFVLLILLTHLGEQLTPKLRMIAYLVLAIWASIGILLLGSCVIWR